MIGYILWGKRIEGTLNALTYSVAIYNLFRETINVPRDINHWINKRFFILPGVLFAIKKDIQGSQELVNNEDSCGAVVYVMDAWH